MLTQKQERFVQCIIDGMSQTEAYKASYNAEKMSHKTITEKACVLMKDDRIKARLKEIRDKMISPSIMSAQERLEWLTKVIKSGEETTTDKLKATDIMNKMQGEYVQKVEADVKNEVTINIELSDD